MGLDLGTISASVRLNTGPLTAGAAKAKGIFKSLDKSSSTSASLFSSSWAGVGLAAAAGVGLLVVGLASCVKEAMEAQKVIAETNAILQTTGGVSNVTADGLAKLSYAIAKKTGYDDEAVQSAGNMLLTFPKVRNEVGATNDIFNQALDLSTDMARKFGTDIPQSAKLLGKALGEPVKGVTALQRMGVMLTETQKEQVKAFVESGNILAAQKVILGEVRSEVGLVAEAYGDTLAGKIDIAKMEFGNLKETIGNALLPVLSNALDAMSKWDWAKIGNTATDVVKTAVGTIQSIWSVLDTLKIPAALSAFAHELKMLADAWNEAFGSGKTGAESATWSQQVEAGFGGVEKSARAHLPGVPKMAKKMLQDVSNTLIGEVPVFRAGAAGLMNGINDVIRTTDLKTASKQKVDEIAQQIAANTNLPVAAIKALLDQLAGKITATDLKTPTGQTMKGMAQGISEMSGYPLEYVNILMGDIRGRVSAEDLAGASATSIRTMAVGISKATGADVDAVTVMLTALSQTIGSYPLIAPNIPAPTASDPTPTAQGVTTSLNNWFGGHVTRPIIAAPSVTDPIYTASGVTTSLNNWFASHHSKPIIDAPDTKGSPLVHHASADEAGAYLANEVVGGMQGTFDKSMTHPVVGGSAMSDLASATALVNASFGNFIKDMTAEPLDEVNNAIMRLTANNYSSLGDWWKLRGAYDAATASLANYEKQITTAEKAVTSLEGKIEKANAARERPSMVMDKASSELQLKIMKAEDLHNYALAAKLTLEKDTLDRKKEELDLTTSIADKTKELKDTSAFAGKTTKQIDAMIATWTAALLKKTNQVAALKVTYEKVQVSVDKFKKIIDDLSAYFTSKSPAPTGYAEGTTYVPRTGMALVHQGEQIIPANLNPLTLGSGSTTLITVPLYLDGKLIAKSVSRYQGGQANSRAMSGGRY